MKKSIVVAKSLFTRRIKKPNYYWMIFAPILLAVIGLFCNHFMQQQVKNSNPTIAIVASKNIKNEILQQNKQSKNHVRFTNSHSHSLKQAQLYLNDGNLDGILYIQDQNDLNNIKYFYKKTSASDSSVKNLEQLLYSVKTQRLAATMGLSLKQIQAIIAPVKIQTTSINKHQTKSTHFLKMQRISQFVVIAGFLILTSYISITGSEIGREKGDHLIESVLSSTSTNSYFAGKMLGVLFLLVFQVMIYALLVGIANLVLPMLHQKALIDLNFFKGISLNYIVLTTLFMVVAVILYILLAAIIASFVSRIEDISQATSSVASLILIPYIIGLIASLRPDIGFIKIFSYIPFASQSIMPVRIATGTVSYTQGWISLFISILTLIPLFFIAGIIYKKNIFKYSNHSLLYNLLH